MREAGSRCGWGGTSDMRIGVTPQSVEQLGAPVSIYPPGHLLLKRGGRKALLDFCATCPPRFREALRASADPDVRAISCSALPLR